MIKDSTARKLLYAWHGGQTSIFYGAASSGLISLNDRELIIQEVEVITDAKDRDRLREWLNSQLLKSIYLDSKNRHWVMLPWADTL